MVLIVDTKICAICGEEKPLAAFHRCSAFRDGRHNRCAVCRQAARRSDSPHARAILEQRALRIEGKKRCHKCREIRPLDGGFYPNPACPDGYASACKSCFNRSCLERQRRDQAAFRARHKRWRDANVEKVRADGRKAAANRRGRIRGAFVENIEADVLFERDEGICGLCGEPVDRARFDVDHVVPLILGGEHSYANTQIAHPSCNRSKGGTLGAAITNARVG